MRIDQMREYILSRYPNETWRRKVAKFHDRQVIAVYYKFLNDERKEVEEKEEEEENNNDKNEENENVYFEEDKNVIYHQMSIFECFSGLKGG